MIKHILILPDGTEVSSGAAISNAIQSVTLTQCANSGEELTLGSCCASMLEAKLRTPGGGLSLNAGDEVTLDRETDGVRSRIGLFTLEKPTRPTAGTMKLTGYDRIIRLDKDLTVWLNGLTGWPYTLGSFAQLVCDECSVELVRASVESAAANIPLQVNKFSYDGVTGRKLIQWIGEALGCFSQVNAVGQLYFSPFGTAAGPEFAPTGDNYYFQNGFTCEDYAVEPVDAVQLKLADSENGYLWPEKAENGYIITGNPILSAVTEDTQAVLDAIRARIPSGYTPGKLTIPARKVSLGSTYTVTDRNGVSRKILAMNVTTKGQKTTIECTGSRKRSSTTAANNKSAAQVAAEQRQYAGNAAAQAVANQTQEDIFNKLTNNGEVQGVFLKDGKVYVNVTYAVAGVLASKDGKTFVLDLENNILKGQFAELSISGKSVSQIAQESVNVGGTNLFRNSEPVDKISPWSGSNATAVAVGKVDGRACVVVDPSTGTQDSGYGVQTVSADGADSYTLSAQVYVEAERVVKLSIWRVVNGQWQAVGSKSFTCAPGWNSVAATVSGLSAEAQIIAGFGAAKSGGKFYVYHPKMEVGNTVTAWSPAPADLEDYADSAVSGQTQQDIFDKLTNNGESQGLFIKDGQLFINASYLATGVIRSADGTVEIDLLNNSVTINTLDNGVKGKITLTANGIYGWTLDETTNDYVTTLVIRPGRNGTSSSNQTLINALSSDLGMQIVTGRTGSTLTLGQPAAKTEIRGSELSVLGKTISFKDNGDGTYTLIGR